MKIPGFSDYDISPMGVVTKMPSGEVIAPVLTRSRANYTYMRVCLTDDSGKTRMHNVLRLLALTYLEKPCRKAEACAIDGNSLNTTLANVMWLPCSDKVRRLWSENKIHRQPRKSTCCTPEAIDMLYDALQIYDEPVSMTELSVQLQVPYSVVRYSMKALIEAGRARKTKQGFEIVE